MANKKYLDEVGLAYILGKLEDYPDNEILAALIDAMQDALDEKAPLDLATQSAPGLMSATDKVILDSFSPDVTTTLSNMAVSQFNIINAKQSNAVDFEAFIEPQIGAQIRTSNLLDVNTFTPGFYIGSSGSLASNANDHVGDFIPVTPGDTIYYTGVIGPTNSSSINRRLHVYNANKTWIKQLSFAGSLKVGDNWSTNGVIPSNGAYVRVSWGVEDTNVMISVGAPVKYEPYYIKPFTTLNNINISISSDGTVENTNTYQINVPVAAGDVYSAKINPIQGKFYVTSGYIDRYNGETLPGQWWSDRDDYSEGTIPTTNAEVVYELNEEDYVKYDITPIVIPLFFRNNQISIDIGVITLFAYYAETFGVSHLTTQNGITMGETNITENDVITWNNNSNLLQTKADITSPDFLGAPTAVTPGQADYSTRLATTNYVQWKMNNLANNETTTKASRNYEVGEYICVLGTFYKVTANIAKNAVLSVGTNIEATTVGDQLKILMDAVFT